MMFSGWTHIESMWPFYSFLIFLAGYSILHIICIATLYFKGELKFAGRDWPLEIPKVIKNSAEHYRMEFEALKKEWESFKKNHSTLNIALAQSNERELQLQEEVMRLRQKLSPRRQLASSSEKLLNR